MNLSISPGIILFCFAWLWRAASMYCTWVLRIFSLAGWDYILNPTEICRGLSPLTAASTSSTLSLSLSSLLLLSLHYTLSAPDCCVTVGYSSAVGLSVPVQWKACTVQVSDPGSTSTPPSCEVQHDWAGTHAVIMCVCVCVVIIGCDGF